MSQLREALRAKLGEIAEFSYSDGCVLFKTEHCTPEELSNISNCGMLDTLARIMAEVVEVNTGM